MWRSTADLLMYFRHPAPALPRIRDSLSKCVAVFGESAPRLFCSASAPITGSRSIGVCSSFTPTILARLPARPYDAGQAQLSAPRPRNCLPKF